MLTRPNVTDSAPRITVSTDAPTASGGNPQFVPFLATEVDGSLDGDFSVRATDQVTFSFEGINLAGARQYTFNDSQARFGESIYYGRTILFGVRAAF